MALESSLVQSTGQEQPKAAVVEITPVPNRNKELDPHGVDRASGALSEAAKLRETDGESPLAHRETSADMILGHTPEFVVTLSGHVQAFCEKHGCQDLREEIMRITMQEVRNIVFDNCGSPNTSLGELALGEGLSGAFSNQGESRLRDLSSSSAELQQAVYEIIAQLFENVGYDGPANAAQALT